MSRQNDRIKALDIMRGMTIAGMILVNNPGGGEEQTYAPLQHADWFGLTPTDLVFPFFMFIMGITTYLSLKKYDFTCTWSCVRKIVKRALMLWFVGLAIAWLFMFTRSMLSEENAALGLWQRIVASANVFDHIRILGVMPRLGICYGLSALIAITLKHKYIPWLIGLIYVGYYLLLECCNGYAHDAGNILAIVDDAVLGSNHVYRWDSPDPEGLLSTLPALGHVLTGFCIGRMVMETKDLKDKMLRLFMMGAVLTMAGFLLAYACPISKKLWTPTFAMTTCGLGSTLLALLVWWVDVRQKDTVATRFFQVFGINPLALFVISDLLLIPLSFLPLVGGQTVQSIVYNNVLCSVLPAEAASLGWALLYVMLNWLCGYWLYKKKIIVKL